MKRLILVAAAALSLGGCVGMDDMYGYGRPVAYYGQPTYAQPIYYGQSQPSQGYYTPQGLWCPPGYYCDAYGNRTTGSSPSGGYAPQLPYQGSRYGYGYTPAPRYGYTPAPSLNQGYNPPPAQYRYGTPQPRYSDRPINQGYTPYHYNGGQQQSRTVERRQMRNDSGQSRTVERRQMRNDSSRDRRRRND